MKAVPGTLQEGGAAFPPTRWSVVLDALQSQSPDLAQAGLTSFCQAYWPALYTFARRRGYPPSDAQDLIQAFFAHMLELNTLSRARQDKGRLRTFLLGSLQHFLANEHDRNQALKRGGGQHFIPMDEHLMEAEAALTATQHLGGVGSYDQAWAATVVDRAWENLHHTLATEGQARWLEELEPFLLGGSTVPPSAQEVAERLGVSIDTLRSALRRLRERYREALRLEVARTVSNPGDVDEELHYLFQLLLA